MGAGNGARPPGPKTSSRCVVVVIDGRSPQPSDVVAAAVRASAVGDVSVVAKRVCEFSELLQDRNRHEPS
jgi:hypothetical protein